MAGKGNITRGTAGKASAGKRAGAGSSIAKGTGVVVAFAVGMVLRALLLVAAFALVVFVAGFIDAVRKS